MKVLVRADASVRLGIGHITRTLTLADALAERGASTIFLCRAPADVLGSLRAHGHEVVPLPEAGAGETEEDHAAIVLCALSGYPVADWLVVDHYRLGRRWEAMLRSAARRIAVIDDLANRDHDCDLLLDQNLCADAETRYAARIPAQVRQLLGPRYALLRPNFRMHRQQVKPRRPPVRRVLVFFGGADAGNETAKALRGVGVVNAPEVAVDVLIGPLNPHYEQLRDQVADLREVTLHRPTSRIDELIAQADLSLGAAGSASWERCCLGLPALLVAVADNQVATGMALADGGVADFLGRATETTPERWGESIMARLESPWITEASERALALVDGLGAERVADAIEGNA